MREKLPTGPRRPPALPGGTGFPASGSPGAAFPNAAAAEEFRRLRPILQRRLGSTTGVDGLLADPARESMVQAREQAEREPPIMAS